MFPAPPCHVIDDFLDDALHGRLLEWVLANERRFAPAPVYRSGEQGVARNNRSNLRLRDFGPADGALRAALLEALPGISAALGSTAPERPHLELELTAYGDGDFYHAHVDTIAQHQGRGAGPTRTISAVYYFHRQPKAFDGGALRLLPWEGEVGTRDIAPADNRLAAFLSWSRHEVLPVRCPSGAFADSRFAINCWYCEGSGD
jgi:SM-20-related protein